MASLHSQIKEEILTEKLTNIAKEIGHDAVYDKRKTMRRK
jgi:hypothetical protein